MHSPIPSKVLWIVALAIFGAIVLVNQIAANAPVEKPTGITEPGIEDQVLLQTKLAVKLGALDPDNAGGVKSLFAGQLDQSEAAVKTATDRLRFAIAIAELDTAAEGMRELDLIDVNTLAEEQAPLKADIQAVRKLLRDEPVSDEEIAGLRTRHGYYADLAITRGKPSTDPARAAVEGGGTLLIAVVVFVCIAAVTALLGSIAGLVILVSMLAKGGPVRRFQQTAEPGTIYLESFCVFMICFALLHIGSPFIFGMLGSGPDGQGEPPWAMTAKLVMQLLLSLTIFWPIVRGVTWDQWKRDMGWRAEGGVLRELGAGVVGYFTMLPFLFVAVLFLLIYMTVSKMMNPDTNPPSNPIAEVIGVASGIQLVLLFVLMTLWAPIVEEHFFRGFLYRHLRSKSGIALSALLSGLFFGLMHGYGGIMLLPVITIGVGFALIREWRGSIWPTAFAHFIHNFTIGACAIGFFLALK